jgi:hypothetical protein
MEKITFKVNSGPDSGWINKLFEIGYLIRNDRKSSTSILIIMYANPKLLIDFRRFQNKKRF